MTPDKPRIITSSGVQVIQKDQAGGTDLIPRRRVAAYCRVSTDKEEQQSSLDTQMESFRALIVSRPGWELADIYADEGLSGTCAANRVQFQRMIADCEAGKIDYVITKSISRFARNTMECLQYVRKLKDLGVFVYFDENRLDTSNTSSEMLLSILAAVAQEESHSISENMKWSLRKRFQAGQPKWVKTYGFLKNENGEYEINEEQAKGVRRIFELYAAGHSIPEVIRTLEKEGIPSMEGGKWWPKSVATVLHNEKFVGDILMQKCYTVDHLSHKKVKNDQTVVPSYYVRDHHEAIVDRKTFNAVQAILAMKDRHLGCEQYPYYGTLRCPICGEKMVRFRLSGEVSVAAWTCGGGKEDAGGECPPYAIQGKYVDLALREAYRGLRKDALKALAENDDPVIADAARVALKWKGKDPFLKKIEYLFLGELVERITFRNWDTAIVEWKFGLQSEVPITYAKPSDVPDADVEYTEIGYVVNGEPIRCGERVSERINRTRADCLTARVQYSERRLQVHVENGGEGR